jgi:metal-sulfur cluster biosynthetic enzyme
MSDIDELWGVLRNILDPEMGESIVDMGIVNDVEVDGNQVCVKLTVNSALCPINFLKSDVRRALESIDWVENVDVDIAIPDF